MKLRLFLGIFILCFICGCGNDNKPTDSGSTSQATTQESSQESSQVVTEGTTEVISQPDTQPATKAPSPSSDFYPINTEGLEVYDAGPYKVIDPDNKRGLSTTLLGYGFGISSNGQVPQASINNQKRFDSMKVQALSVDIKSSEKTLYLTFDCGYEYQDNTSLILNTLKEKQAPAAFFCTYPFITSNSAKVQRMIDEGHIVGNHSTTHPNFPDITRVQMAKELYGVYEVLKRE
ncbi:MAG: polysaccharide deacetylase family protein, partial [Lachnospiraceae bacterium]